MFSRPVLYSWLVLTTVLLESTQGFDVIWVEEIPAALTVYTRYVDYDEDGLDLNFAIDFCEDLGYRLARIKDWTLLDTIQEPSYWDEIIIDGYKSSFSIYFRFDNDEIVSNALNFEPEDVAVRYDTTARLHYDDLDIEINEVYNDTGGFLCEVPYIDDTPEKDVGYVTCEPYEEWEIVTGTVDLGFDEARQFCKDQDGEMLSMYTNFDVDWAVGSGELGPHVYWQDFKIDPFDNNLRWANGYALLDGLHPNTPFYISPDELFWDSYEYFHHFPDFSALVYNHDTATAGFVDIRSHSARAVCKVHISVKDECESDPCENGGTCLDLVGDYYCACTKDYTGKNCEMEVNDCAPNPCYNGGTCYTDDESEWECACPSGFSGDRCQDNINECESSPCKNGGMCFDGDNEYTCSCPAKIQGSNCELDTRRCNINSCNGRGMCVEHPDSNQYFCVKCDAGYHGDKCELRLKCSSSSPPCLRGSCINLREEDSYFCNCPEGWQGQNCEQRDCSTMECFNGGTIRTQDCSCGCTSKYNGEHCENEIVVPTSDPCLNRCRFNEHCELRNGAVYCLPIPMNPPPQPPTPVQSSNDVLIIGLSVGGGLVLVIIILVVVYWMSRPAASPFLNTSAPQQFMSMYPYGNSPRPRPIPMNMPMTQPRAIMNSPYRAVPNYGFRV